MMRGVQAAVCSKTVLITSMALPSSLFQGGTGKSHSSFTYPSGKERDCQQMLHEEQMRLRLFSVLSGHQG